MRPLLLVRLVLLLLVHAAAVGCATSADAPPSADPGDGGGPRASVADPAVRSFPASDVLRAWDRARSRAFADGDVAALRELYVDGSRAGTTDARLLRAYLGRGLRVEGMRMQVLAIEVLQQDQRRLRLRVTDRVVGAEAVSGTSRTPLPRDAPSRRVLELRRGVSGGAEGWQVAWVRAAGESGGAGGAGGSGGER